MSTMSSLVVHNNEKFMEGMGTTFFLAMTLKRSANVVVEANAQQLPHSNCCVVGHK